MFAGMAIDKTAFPPEVLRHYQDNALRPGAMTAMLNYYRANLSGFMRDAPTPVIEVPTLMIWGEEDAALGLELTEGYEPYVTDFTLERLPNVSHWVQQEAPTRCERKARLLASHARSRSDPALIRGHPANGPLASVVGDGSSIASIQTSGFAKSTGP